MENVLPISIIIATLILSGTIFVVGNSINTNITGLATAVKTIQAAGNVPSDNSGNGAAQAQPAQPAQPSAPVDMRALADNDPVKGKADAPITIIEFSDFQCPFCGQWFSNSNSQLQSYIDQGKVKFIYRDFPLSSIHPFAEPAANAAECANDQGKFWEYHDNLFKNQSALDEASLKKYASDLKLDTAKFNSCFDAKKFQTEIDKDFNDGAAVGVSGTPTFFINGQKVVGAQPWTSFKSIIEAELSKA